MIWKSGIRFTPEISNTSLEEEKDVPFYTEFVMFSGLKFMEIHGQGTAFIVQGPLFKNETK